MGLGASVLGWLQRHSVGELVAILILWLYILKGGMVRSTLVSPVIVHPSTLSPGNILVVMLHPVEILAVRFVQVFVSLCPPVMPSVVVTPPESEIRGGVVLGVFEPLVISRLRALQGPGLKQGFWSSRCFACSLLGYLVNSVRELLVKPSPTPDILNFLVPKLHGLNTPLPFSSKTLVHSLELLSRWKHQPQQAENRSAGCHQAQHTQPHPQRPKPQASPPQT
mmetsp:Transcript_16342/g.25381  ORF Transcript_16342/g.25381 Transcript_16342/m.25381 type:complete len:223 (-) Transcript_16342:60-728(-)